MRWFGHGARCVCAYVSKWKASRLKGALPWGYRHLVVVEGGVQPSPRQSEDDHERGEEAVAVRGAHQLRRSRRGLVSVVAKEWTARVSGAKEIKGLFQP
eukprot:6181961-Pleurochrysis_carterae.AAC.1